MKPCSVFLSLLFGLCATLQTTSRGAEERSVGIEVENFALIDHEGKFHELDYYLGMPGVKGIVIFIQGNGCPLVQKRVPEFNRLQAEYLQRGVLFCMLNANRQDLRDEIATEAKEFGIKSPILKDEAQLVAQMLGVKRTAEVLLLAAEGRRIVYRGAIDDRMSYQKEKPTAKEQYLRDALESLLAGEEIAVSETDAPGCKISMPRDSGELTYTRDIAPILKSKCVECHSRGGLAPFQMSSYRKVEGWADMIAEVILTKQMPPWHADPEIGSFSNDCSLAADEARKIVTWVRDGCPRGEGDDPLEQYRPELPDWHLGTPQQIIALPEQEVAAEGVFDYRYATLDNPFEQDVWLTASEIKPGNTRVLHHVIVTAHPPETREHEQWITGYAPGTQGQVYPEGSAVHLRKGWKLRFQLHYTASGRDEIDATELGLHFSTQPAEKEFRTAVIAHQDFAIPPGSREYTAQKSIKIRKDSTLYAINPHMHFRGKYMNFTARFDDGRRQPLLSVPNYNFNWQRTYVFAEPIKVPAGTRIDIRNAWDNSKLNPHNPDPGRRVTWGDQSFDEMFFATIGYIED